MRWVLIVSVLCLGAGMALGGGLAPLGRVLLAAGLPGVATPFMGDADWRATSAYHAQDWDSAADGFAAARAHFNLGNAEVQRGNYAAALEAYDVAIAQGHPNAKANFDAVAAFYAGLAVDPDAVGFFPKRDSGPEAEAPVGKGSGRAAGTGDDQTNTAALLGAPELDSRGRLGVRRVFDDRFMRADDRWLQQLADVPGEYLKARIAHERKRRTKLGLTPPEPEDPR